MTAKNFANFKNEYIKSTSILAGSRVLETLLSYVLIIILTRALGAEGLGQYAFAFSLVTFFFLFDDLGMKSSMVKDLSKNFSQAKKYLNNILTLKIILGVASLIVYLTSTFFIGKNDLLFVLFLVGIHRFIDGIHPAFNSILRVKKRAGVISISTLIHRFISVLGALSLWIMGGTLVQIVIAVVVGRILSFLFTAIVSLKYVSYHPQLDKIFLKDIIKKSIPFTFVALFATVYVQIDTVFLSFIRGDEIVGWYNAGYRLINIINIVPAMLMVFGFSTISEISTVSKRDTQKALKQLMYASLAIVIPAIVGAIVLGRPILNFIYSMNAPEAYYSMIILLIAEIFIFLSAILGNFVAALDFQKDFSKIAGVGAVINIILNCILIPRWSLYGAGLATLASYLIIFILLNVLVRKKAFKVNMYQFSFIPLLGSLIMAAILFILPPWNFIIKIILGVIIYALVTLSADHLLRKEDSLINFLKFWK